jgi:hypothetical protein
VLVCSLREEYCWLVAGGWSVVREKYRWLVADKPSEQGVDFIAKCKINEWIHPSHARSICGAPSNRVSMTTKSADQSLIYAPRHDIAFGRIAHVLLIPLQPNFPFYPCPLLSPAS